MSVIDKKVILQNRMSLAEYKKQIEQQEKEVKKKRRSLEYEEQCKVFEWVAFNLPKRPLLSLLFAIPNGELRDKITAAKLKRAGVKSGVFDMFLPVQSRATMQIYNGLWIELKIKPNKPTSEQLRWQLAMQQQGFKAVICYSADEVIGEILYYLSF